VLLQRECGRHRRIRACRRSYRGERALSPHSRLPALLQGGVARETTAAIPRDVFGTRVARGEARRHFARRFMYEHRAG